MLTLRASIDFITAKATCWQCNGTTPVSLLRARQTFDAAKHITVDQAIVVQPSSLPDAVSRAAEKLNPGFRLVQSDRIRPRHYWANHCMHCDALHGEYSLHTEPDGPFFGGLIPSEAVSVRLLDVGEYQIDAGHGY